MKRGMNNTKLSGVFQIDGTDRPRWKLLSGTPEQAAQSAGFRVLPRGPQGTRNQALRDQVVAVIEDAEGTPHLCVAGDRG